MKKLRDCKVFWVIVLIVTLWLVVGCNEAQKSPAAVNLPDSWVKLYGDSRQSVRDYNIVKYVELHHKKLIELSGRMRDVEEKAVMDGDIVRQTQLPWSDGTQPKTSPDFYIHKADPNDPNG